jgi:phage/plasmid-associated DNA primase
MSNYDDNREWANSISETLEHSTKESLEKYLEDLEKKWKLGASIECIFSNILSNFNIKNLGGIDMAVIETEYNKTIWEVTGVHSNFQRFKFNDAIKLRWEKLFENIYYSERLLRTNYVLLKMTHENYTYKLNEDSCGLFKFMPITYDKNTPYQNLLLYLLSSLNEKEYARYQSDIYIKIVTKDGLGTYAWKQHTSIEDFIYSMCKKEFNFDQWKNSTAGGLTNIKNATEYLTKYKGIELPALEKDRYLFAFKNGNYITYYNNGTTKKPEWNDVFVPYGKSHPYLKTSSVACKYFDVDFNNFDEIKKDSWFDIMEHCPNFKKLLDYQEFPPDVQMWLCILMGRCVFNIGDLDNWQAVLYLLGQAATGKSTILTKILQKWYDECDVGMISNNIEKKYGLKPHADKFMVLAPEIKDDFCMEQTDWQLVCEGGRNTFAEKYKNAESVSWKAHMSMGGNMLPRYKNNSGSVSRRTVVFSFWKAVRHVDTHLDKKLDLEIPIIMKLCITGYLWAVNKYEGKGIWSILPKYFHENKDEMEQTTNSLQHFIRSGKVTLDPDVYIPEKVFKQIFNDHCRENNLGKEQFTADYYSGLFNNNSIKIKKRTRKEYPIGSGVHINGTFFVGVDIINETDTSDDVDPDP